MTTKGAMMTDALRQLLAALEAERQALAGMDVEALSLATTHKDALCASLAGAPARPLTDEERGLAETARALNDLNRRTRNLLAAHTAARLDALTGAAACYTLRRPADGSST
ncbi:flagellar protein FlgN [Erythrobacteraceae bacterium CFH 75059]|uniref:flagellar protein FlgN n=1 Tax=Qipengyuania thermophila TaxID=2509361 RepID=UPI001021D966|nr:flagellar protein FlgN [Qipengyuania thermophila]TCD06294.1 flagellar protein FlgN [Erythrobacteraceae bacterium CFH 75059]